MGSISDVSPQAKPVAISALHSQRDENGDVRLRVFCILIDPDGFDIDTEETTGIDTSDANVLAAYKSEIFNFYVTVEILPVQPGDGFETSAD